MSKKKHKKKPKPSLKNKPYNGEFSNLDSRPHFRHTVSQTYFGPALILFTAVIMAWWSWGKWTDPMIDFGRELYIPWQILGGSTLYKDIAYFNGPLSPYINSLWFFLLGVHMRSLIIANFIILALITLFLYKLLKNADSKIGATIGCLVLIIVFAFPRYDFVGNYNFITPYSHEMTHGLLLSLLGLYVLSRYQLQKKSWMVFLSGLFLGLVFLTKTEFALAGGIAIFSGFIITFWSQKEPYKQILLKISLLLSGAFIPPIISFLLLSIHMPLHLAFLGTLGSWPGTFNSELRNSFFYKQIMGTYDLGLSVKIVCISFISSILIFLPTAILSAANAQRKKRDLIIGIAVGTGMVTMSILMIHSMIKIGSNMIRPLPVLLIVLITIEGIHIFKNNQNNQYDQRILRFTLSLFSLVLLTKILLRVEPNQYGFALAMPGTVILISVLVDRIPAFLNIKGRAGEIFRFFSLSIIIIFAGLHVFVSGFWLNKSTVQITTENATFYTDIRGYPIREAIEEIKKHSSVDDTLAVLPEGVMLNFLTQRKNPTPYINFMPPEFILFGESNMLNAFHATPPDYIVLTNKPLEEYGFQEAGIDIGVELYQWIENNYALVKKIAPEYESNLPFTRIHLFRRMDPIGSNLSQKSQ